jgi:hypothetical protein
VNEAIAVEARFEEDGVIHPLAFMWRGKRYQVASLGRYWEQDGEHRFLVMTHGEQIYELAYLPTESAWRLRRRSKDFRISDLAV